MELKMVLLYSLIPLGLYFGGVYVFNLARATYQLIRIGYTEVSKTQSKRGAPEKYERPLPVRIFWGDGRNCWDTDNLNRTRQKIVAWINNEVQGLQTTVDAYERDWILDDPFSGAEISKDAASFEGIHEEVRWPRVLRIRLLTGAAGDRHADVGL